MSFTRLTLFDPFQRDTKKHTEVEIIVLILTLQLDSSVLNAECVENLNTATAVIAKAIILGLSVNALLS